MKQMQCNATPSLNIKTTTKQDINLVALYSQDYAAGIRGHYHKSSVCFQYPQNPYINQATQKQMLAKFSYPKKIPKSKISNPTKSRNQGKKGERSGQEVRSQGSGKQEKQEKNYRTLHIFCNWKLDKEAGANKKGGGSGIKGYQGSGKFVPHYPLYSLLPPVSSHYIHSLQMEKHKQAGANIKGEGSGIKGYQWEVWTPPPVNYTPFFPCPLYPLL